MVGKGGIAEKAKSRSRGAMAEKVGRLWRLWMPAKRSLGAVGDFELYKKLFWLLPFYWNYKIIIFLAFVSVEVILEGRKAVWNRRVQFGGHLIGPGQGWWCFKLHWGKKGRSGQNCELIVLGSYLDTSIDKEIEIRWSWGFNEILYAMQISQCLAHCKYAINDSHYYYCPERFEVVCTKETGIFTNRKSNPIEK